MTDDFFRARLDGMIDPRHSLTVLAQRLPWAQIERTLAPCFARKARPEQWQAHQDLFGASAQPCGGGISNAGRSRLPLRLMVALTLLKNSFDLSDEEMVERFAENVYWQYFAGYEYFDPTPPCDATQIGRFRSALGEAGMEELLKATIETAVHVGAVRKSEFERLIVDTTVQEKAMAHPVDSRLLEIARHKVVTAAKAAGIALKQTFAGEGKTLRRQAGGYAHAKQFKRLRKAVKRQRTILGILIREVQRKLSMAMGSANALAALAVWLERAERIRSQQRKDKKKLYALHAPEVECIGKGKAQITMDQVEPARVARYASADVDMTLRLVPLLQTEMAQKRQTELFDTVEMPLVPVICAIERAGVLLDVPFLKRMELDLAQRLTVLIQEIHALAGLAFNINSTQQLADVLFGKLAIPATSLARTPTGKISLTAGVLEGMAGKHPIIDKILEYRQLGKLQSTYVLALPNLINPRTGRVHTSFNQAGAETGRLSSSNPNLQNIPIRTEIGRQVRRAFIAPTGWQLIAADYSQVELRIVAHASRDPNLLGAFERGEDVHASTAAAVYGVPLAEVTKAMRARAKTVNFGLVYGQGAYGLAQQTGMTTSEATEFISRYFTIYAQVKTYLDSLRVQASQVGYVETLLGRRRYFPELAPSAKTPFNVRQGLERAAINAPIQGTSADIIKLAMIRLAQRLQEAGLRARMILQVHDELVLEAPEAEIDRAVALVREVMSNAFTLCIPLKVDVEVGPNWLETEAY